VLVKKKQKTKKQKQKTNKKQKTKNKKKISEQPWRSDWGLCKMHSKEIKHDKGGCAKCIQKK